MCRIIRVPLPLDQCFRPREQHVHWNHCSYFRLLVVVIASRWGRRHVANLYRDLDVEHHRTRVHHFCLIERWDPAAALRQKAHELLVAVPPQPGDTVYLMIDDAQKATRGSQLEAVTTMKDPTTEASMRGPQDVCALLADHDHVIPWGLRLYVTTEHGAALGLPVHQTTALAAPLIRAFQAPAGVQVRVLCDAYSLGHTVVQAGRDQGFHLASTLKGHRRLCQQGWRRKAGRDGPHLFRRRRPTLVVIDKPHGHVRYRWVAAGWLQVSTLGPWHVVFSRTGAARKIRGLVTDDPELPAVRLIPTYETRWAVARFFKDAQPLLGLGHDQNRSDGAAGIHRHLVCCADALLTHRRLTRHGAPGQRIHQKAADWSLAAAQDHLRGLMWDD